MISQSVVDWITSRQTGVILYTSPSKSARENSLKAMAQVSLCETKAGFGCECSHCYNIREGIHPHIAKVTDATFDQQMATLYSLPTPIVQIEEIQSIGFAKQTKLLIWLESIGKNRLVMITTNAEYGVLPTIRSRSVVFTEIPRYTLSPEESQRAVMFLQSIYSGKERFESIQNPDEAKKLAMDLRTVVVIELLSRVLKPTKKALPGSEHDLTMLVKILDRYLSDSAVHNLRLMLTAFSTHILPSLT